MRVIDEVIHDWLELVEIVRVLMLGCQSYNAGCQCYDVGLSGTGLRRWVVRLKGIGGAGGQADTRVWPTINYWLQEQRLEGDLLREGATFPAHTRERSRGKSRG